MKLFNYFFQQFKFYILINPIIKSESTYQNLTTLITSYRVLLQTMPIMCGKEQHFASFYFCQYCAKKGVAISVIFFCSECQFIKKNTHRTHSDDLMLVSSQAFNEPLRQIRSIIFKVVQQIKLRFDSRNSGMNFAQILTKMQDQNSTSMLKMIDDKTKFSSLLLNQDIVKWLLQVKFWQGRSRETLLPYESRIKTVVSEIMMKNQFIKKVLENFVPPPPPPPQKDFEVDLPQNSNGEIVEREIKSLEVENALKKKEADICNMVIKLMTSFNCEELWATESECQDLLKKYPDSKVLHLSMIRINELLPGGNSQIPQILQNIVKNVDLGFQATDMYHYYMAMAQWQLIEKEQRGSECIWFELKNKRYYRLNNPDAYIASLNRAIAVRQKPAYYIGLGIGYIVKENYQEALSVFKQASSMLSKRSDALDLNKCWAQVKYDSSELEFEAIMQNLETRTLQFISNICKYFKSSKNYEQLVVCCEQLISREPERWNFKIHFIKSILSYSSTVNEFNHDDHERLSRADRMIEELKIAEDREAGKLQKRLTRVKAQNEFKNNNLTKASEGFEALTKNTKLTSGSDYYNYAATQFAQFIEDQCRDEFLIKQAYEGIKKALLLKPKKIKYMKLKFFVCSYMNLFNEANHAYEQLKRLSPSEIDDKEYDRLIEYVRDNMEVETPTPGQ